jgi:predicted porin
MKLVWFTATAAIAAFAGAASAQQVTMYGRLGVALGQPADSAEDKQVRNDYGSRLGVRGSEDLGGGLKAIFNVEHRFNVDTGAQSNSTRFWEGKSIVGLEGGFGRVALGREQNPAYAFAQEPADPWATYTVAANGSIINGRIGSTRYSNSVNYSIAAGGFAFGAQIAEAEGNESGTTGLAEKRPYSLGGRFTIGGFAIGLGYENPTDEDDYWASVVGSYTIGDFKLIGFFGSGKNTDNQKHQAYMAAATFKIGAGEVRASYGRLRNKDLDVEADDQLALGYNHSLSKRTSLYATVSNERRDDFPADRKKTGYDLGVRHDF